MKLLMFFIAISANLCAQSDLQFIKIRNLDRSVDLSVINNSNTDYDIMVKIDLVNMESDKEFPVDLVVKANSKLRLANISPLSEERGNYVLSYKIIAREDSYTYVPNLTIYTKNRNKRSTQLLIYLNQNGIAYNELNTSYNSDTKEIYRKMLERRNISHKVVKLPVIIYRGEAYYDIKNVKKFCKEHFEGEGHFIKKRDRRY
jgi:hypothetical protein